MNALRFKQAQARGSHLFAANDPKVPVKPSLVELYEGATEDELDEAKRLQMEFPDRQSTEGGV
jgi:hypothetical protein